MPNQRPVPELSVVVLCYRSEDNVIPYVAQVERELQAEGLTNYELVLVGNYFPGSGDRTPEIIQRLARGNPRVVPLTLEKQGMMGWDVISGFAKASGAAVALIDGDGQMPPRDIARLYRVLKSGEFDLVKTFRIRRHDGAYRRFISQWYNALFHLLFPGTPFRDINSKPKLLRRSALERMKLECHGWFSDGEIMLECRRLGLSFAEIPTEFHANEWRSSFVKFWTIFEIVGSLFAYRLKYWLHR